MTRSSQPQEHREQTDERTQVIPSSEVLLAVLTKYFRQAMVGRRIAGIVHALNTPLQVLLMQAELMGRKLQDEEASFAPQLPPELLPLWQDSFTYRQRKNQQLSDMADKIQEIVNWLKYHTLHEDQHGPRAIDLNELIQSELQGYLLEKFFKNQINRRLLFQDQLPPIMGYYIDFSQSFCILVDNAVEALQGVSAPILTIATSLEDGYRVIAVGDNGPGIPPEHHRQLFTPFFTTKHSPTTPRAGLGLFFAKQLLAPYGGQIHFTSQPGETWFRILLP